MSNVSLDVASTAEASMMPPPNLMKTSSHQPAFMSLAGAPNAAASAQYQSKVFLKRNFLFNELKQVLVSVEQCASLFLLEDFLRNRIRNLDDVKTLKTPPAHYSQSRYGGGVSSKIAVRAILDKAINKMRDIIEGSGSRESMREESEEFQDSLIEEILTAKDLNDLD